MGLFSCTQQPQHTDTANQQVETIEQRIVSLNGTITEILALAGLDSQIVGADVTSTYPASLHGVPRVGHVRSLQAEGILALQPTTVLGLENEVKPEVVSKLQSAGVNVKLYARNYSVDGAKMLISQILTDFNAQNQIASISATIDNELGKVEPLTVSPKVLFIYARGGGNVMLAGDNTPIKTFIELSNAQNAITGFDDYKPLTPEVLVSANPDVILLFDSGLQSLEGHEGLLSLPAMKQTNAAKKNHIITMDGQLMTGFGPRLGQAIAEFNHKLKELGY
jgi:iron complex transport system substrate-binding protein